MPRIYTLIFFLLISCTSSQANETKIKHQFESVSQEDLKATKWDVGDTTITNEDRLDLFKPYVQNLQGGYIGVGSSQNLSLAVWARSEWVWLMDFTRIVVAVNKINIAFIVESKTPAEFRQLWKKNSKSRALSLIKKYYENEPDFSFIQTAWIKSRPYQERRFKHDDITTKKYNFELWLDNLQDYNYIRELAIKGRIQAIKGDLRGKTTVMSVAKTARDMGLTMRVVYYSNAEEYFDLDGQFRDNWLSMPIDEKSVIVRTISVDKWNYPWAPGSELSTSKGFHYNIQKADNYQNWLKISKPKLRTRHILKKSQIDKANGFSYVDSGPEP